MRQYIVRRKGEKIFRCDSMEEAVKSLHDYIYCYNSNLEYKDWNTYVTPRDFIIESEKESDINERISSYEEAMIYLRKHDIISRHPVFIDRVNSGAMFALEKLITIAKAWNMEDEFTPDWSDEDESKYCPIFDLCGGTVMLVAQQEVYHYNGGLNVNLFFKTEERARQFGEQFIDLWKKYLLG